MFKSMYENGLIDAYIKVGKSYREGGWYHKALNLFDKALEENPHHKEVKKEYEVTKKMMESQEVKSNG
ncbi:MAG: tetratricopeptide repeat protein [Desulfobacterota bacterium]|nr:tetratricopeptide repeat protein [Thermodesulfobacteriota bacterium]